MTTQDELSRDAERLLALFVQLGRTRPMRDPLAAISELDMSSPSLHTLMWLGLEGHLPMSTLAERVGISLPNATRTVDRLSEAGYLLRERDPEDRRRVQVRLSRKGHRLWEKMQQAIHQKAIALLSGLTPEERSQFVGLFERLAQRLTEAEMGSPTPRTAS